MRKDTWKAHVANILRRDHGWILEEADNHSYRMADGRYFEDGMTPKDAVEADKYHWDEWQEGK